MELRDDPQGLRDDPKPGWRLRDWTPPGCSVLLMVSQDCIYVADREVGGCIYGQRERESSRACEAERDEALWHSTSIARGESRGERAGRFVFARTASIRVHEI